MDAGNLQETFLAVIKEDLQPAAARITVPTLLIWGAQDTETPLSDAKKLHSLIKGSKLVVMNEAGHFVHREVPEKVTKAMEDFL